MEETDEVIISGAEANTNIWGELRNKICHKLHVLLHSRFYFLHSSNALIFCLIEQGSRHTTLQEIFLRRNFRFVKTEMLFHFFLSKTILYGPFHAQQNENDFLHQINCICTPSSFKFQLCPWHFYIKACNAGLSRWAWLGKTQEEVHENAFRLLTWAWCMLGFNIWNSNKIYWRPAQLNWVQVSNFDFYLIAFRVIYLRLKFWTNFVLEGFSKLYLKLSSYSITCNVWFPHAYEELNYSIFGVRLNLFELSCNQICAYFMSYFFQYISLLILCLCLLCKSITWSLILKSIEIFFWIYNIINLLNESLCLVIKTFA